MISSSSSMKSLRMNVTKVVLTRDFNDLALDEASMKYAKDLKHNILALDDPNYEAVSGKVSSLKSQLVYVSSLNDGSLKTLLDDILVRCVIQANILLPLKKDLENPVTTASAVDKLVNQTTAAIYQDITDMIDNEIQKLKNALDCLLKNVPNSSSMTIQSRHLLQTVQWEKGYVPNAVMNRVLYCYSLVDPMVVIDQDHDYLERLKGSAASIDLDQIKDEAAVYEIASMARLSPLHLMNKISDLIIRSKDKLLRFINMYKILAQGLKPVEHLKCSTCDAKFNQKNLLQEHEDDICLDFDIQR